MAPVTYIVNGKRVDPHGNVVEAAKPASPAKPKAEGLSALTVAELDKLAEERGVEFTADMRKAEKVAALEAAEQGEPASEGQPAENGGAE